MINYFKKLSVPNWSMTTTVPPGTFILIATAGAGSLGHAIRGG